MAYAFSISWGVKDIFNPEILMLPFMDQSLIYQKFFLCD